MISSSWAICSLKAVSASWSLFRRSPMEAASCSAFLRAFSFCSSLLARSSARLLALARASSGKKQYRSQDKDSNIVCSTKNKIAYSHGGVPFKPLTVSRYPTNCVPRLMKCCIRGCRKEKTTKKVQGIKKKFPRVESPNSQSSCVPRQAQSSLSLARGLGGW